MADDNNTVVEYSKADLAKASPAPTVTISSSGLNHSDGLAFDPSGDLSVANPDHSRVRMT